MRNNYESLGPFIQSTARVDFALVNRLITFNSGDDSVCIEVTILGDLEAESTESFSLSLSSQQASIDVALATVVIFDDDQGKVIRVIEYKIIVD